MIIRPAFFFSGGAGLPDAPTLVDAINNSASWSSGSNDPQILATSGLDWTAGQRIISTFSCAGGTDVVGVSGSTNDTGAELASVTANVCSLYMHEITVNGGALDASISFDLNENRPAVAFLLTVSDDTDTITTPAENSGSGFTQPSSAAFAVSGTKNRLLVAVVAVRGGHDANPPIAPTGYTMISVAPHRSSTTETSTVHTTQAIAVKEALGSSGTIPAATWQGLADIGTQPWSTLHFALEPA